jgi:hypothetical protein
VKEEPEMKADNQTVFDRVMPNGKRLGECTVAELREMAEQAKQKLLKRAEDWGSH